ncbi:MAG: DUF3299 domain-containing protein [Oleiphilaceae bacterium]|nr:DUF3299 domain-containing protein [Oleiphilaceae bacterium]
MVTRLLCCVLIWYCAMSAAWAKDYQTTDWDALMPPDWVPEFNEQEYAPDLSDEEDDAAWLSQFNSMPAPTVPELNNQPLRIPGYVLPVKYDGSKVYEFLLVPYVGACIHVPPPPANQMVYVILDQPLEAAQLWEPVWASGIMKTEIADTKLATAGYKMLKATIERYEY